MTQQQKRARRAAIKQLADKQGNIEPVGYLTYWVTRDSRNGVLSDLVDIWLTRPERFRYLNDGEVVVSWSAVYPDHTTSLYGQWTVDQIYCEIRSGLPQTDRESVCVGRVNEAVTAS